MLATFIFSSCLLIKFKIETCLVPAHATRFSLVFGTPKQGENAVAGAETRLPCAQ